MTTYSKLNFVYRLQKWMDSVAGQTFLNYAYSWGASIVILGTLFKLTHLPGANFFLFLGMGTEVFVFFISAFDRPFDKTADGMELDIHMEEEEGAEHSVVNGGVVSSGVGGGIIGGGGTIVINGGGTSGGADVSSETADHTENGTINFAGGSSVIGGGVIGGGIVAPQQTEVPGMGEELKEATSNYIDELNRLTEMLAEVSAQSQRLTRDSEEMENLNRTLTGISRVYEMQLKSASSQINTIDEINEQTRHMAEQIQELNKIYARMIEAMQVRANI
jgi:hypothetical protein